MSKKKKFVLLLILGRRRRRPPPPPPTENTEPNLTLTIFSPNLPVDRSTENYNLLKCFDKRTSKTISFNTEFPDLEIT